ncbi:MAG TPA: YggT family protein [Vicinamibacteria bacterium]|nr:YggT family protein [Vicinamibacteria bacterium]
MFALGNALMGLGTGLDFFLQLYSWVLIGRAIVSWVNADPRNAIVRFLVMATDPVVERVRRLLPMKLRYFPLDLAFLVTFGIIIFLRYALAKTLIDAGARMARP